MPDRPSWVSSGGSETYSVPTSPGPGQGNPDVPPQGVGLGGRAARGALITLGGLAARMLTQTASVVVLARLLAPDDYGLMAMAMVLVGLGEIFRDFGLSSAAIQAPDLTTHQRDNLFWVNAAIGALLSAIVLAGAPLVALFYERAEVTSIIRVIAIVFLLNGFATQYRASLARALRFAAVAAADVSGVVVGFGVALFLAMTGAGYWALVGQVVSQSATSLLVVLVAGRWLPRWPSRDPGTGALLRFGWHLVGSQLLSFAGNNADTVLVGARFGAGPLGLYNRAYQLLMTPLVQMLAPTSTVAVPVFSRLAQQPQRFAQFLLRAQLALGYTIVVALAAVAAAAGPITRLVLGDRWEAVVPLLALMAIAGGLQTLSYVGYWVYVSMGLTAELRRYSLVSTTLRISCIAVGSYWGVTGVALGFAVAPALAWPLSIWWLSRHAPIPTRGLLLGAVRIIAVGSTVAAPVAAVANVAGTWAPWASVLACLGTAAAVYATMAFAIRKVRADVSAVLFIVRKGLER